MNTIVIKQQAKIAISDIILLALACFVPTFVHLTAMPLYVFDPMRILLFAGILLNYNKANSCLLAVLLPLSAYIIGSHPVFLKSILFSTELVTNTLILFLLIGKKLNPFIACFISIVISKVLYYALKAICIYIGTLETSIIDTQITKQVLIALIIAIIFQLFKVK